MNRPQVSPPLSPRALAFIESVLRTQPRLAAFDCDGTLWNLDAGEGFFYWSLKRGLVSKERESWARGRYQQYRAGRVSEEQMCGEMVTIYAGLADSRLATAAAEYFDQNVAPLIFPEMQELTRRLAAAGCELWAVSSTNDWVIRAAAPRFAIPAERVIAAAVHAVNGAASDRLIQVPTDETKATAVRQLLPRPPDAAFGNSVHDLAMLELAAHPFAIGPTPELERAARERQWTIYQPDGFDLKKG